MYSSCARIGGFGSVAYKTLFGDICRLSVFSVFVVAYYVSISRLHLISLDTAI